MMFASDHGGASLISRVSDCDSEDMGATPMPRPKYTFLGLCAAFRHADGGSRCLEFSQSTQHSALTKRLVTNPASTPKRSTSMREKDSRATFSVAFYITMFIASAAALAWAACVAYVSFKIFPLVVAALEKWVQQ